MNHARLYDIMSGKATGTTAAATRLGLSLLEPGYRLGVTLRNRQFDTGKRTTARLPRPVISVGNITTGGTGKTPMVIELARRLIAQGQTPAVLMRGYMKGSAASGGSDEAAELRRELGAAVPIMPNPDRVQGAKHVLEQHPRTTVFLLDDGFQHRQVHRDLDIVLIDATRPFGFDHLLPRGLLREPARNLRRADAVIVTRCNPLAEKQNAELDSKIKSICGQLPIAHTHFAWGGYQSGSEEFGFTYLNGKKVVGVCAVGNPAAFMVMLAHAAEILAVHTLDDHHSYTKAEVQSYLDDAAKQGADAVLVTGKDWVKWQPILESLRAEKLPPVVRPKLRVSFMDGTDNLDRLLEDTCQTRRGKIYGV